MSKKKRTEKIRGDGFQGGLFGQEEDEQRYSDHIRFILACRRGTMQLFDVLDAVDQGEDMTTGVPEIGDVFNAGTILPQLEEAQKQIGIAIEIAESFQTSPDRT